MATLTDLREYPKQGWLTVYDAYRAGTLTCPECDCTKSGDVAEPNRRTDACTKSDCRCHDASATDAPVSPWVRMALAHELRPTATF